MLDRDHQLGCPELDHRPAGPRGDPEPRSPHDYLRSGPTSSTPSGATSIRLNKHPPHVTIGLLPKRPCQRQMSAETVWRTATSNLSATTASAGLDLRRREE